MNQKIRVIKIWLLFLFIPILFSLYYIQGYKGEFYYRKSLKNILRLIPYVAQRGTISDCNDKKIVDNYPSFQIAIMPQEVKDLEYVFKNLGKQFSISSGQLKKRYKNRYHYPFVPVAIIKDVSKTAAIKFQINSNLNGVIVQVSPKRKYIYKKVASHILGFLGRIDSAQLKSLKKYGYSFTDYIGKSGVEQYFDTYLRGKTGGCLVEVDSKGNRQKVIGLKNSVKGKDIKLTIDIELQEFVDNILSKYNGSVIVMEPSTGYIRALISKPNFDPNIFLSQENYMHINDLLGDANSPLFNRAISAVYPPGSIFKIVTAIAGLEENTINLEDKFFCNGYTKIGASKFKCWYDEGHKNINLIEALKYSCNVFFYKLGVKLGVEKLNKYAGKMGLGEKTHIELLSEFKGTIPSKSYKKERFNKKWYKGDTVNFSIGQGYIQITPIQALRMISIVANNGLLANPKLIESIGDIDVSTPELKNIDISKETFKKVEKGLMQVVEAHNGTGRLANISGITIAGKTGTAQVNSKKSHAWFVGYAPVKDTEICIVIMLEHGGKGGVQAARIAKKIFKYYFSL